MIRFERVSLSKIWRKIAADGIIDTIYASIEFGSRRVILKPIFTYMIRRGLIDTAEFDSLDTTYGSPTVSPRVNNGYVFLSTGLVADCNGKLLFSSVSEPTSNTSYQAVTLVHHIFRDGLRIGLAVAGNNTSKWNTVAVEADIVTPLIPRYNNYFHWLIETLPRLRYVEQYQQETGESPTVLIPPSTSGWMRESLELVAGDQFDIQKASAAIYRPSLTVATTQSHGTSADYQWLTQRIFDQISVDPGSPKNRIYISRKNARDRRVRNESAVISMLAEYGFESYCLEEYSVAEQVALFANADIVVAPHGAGLSNIVFSEDVTVVELFGSKIKDNFKNLSEACSLTYLTIYCESVGTDMIVDVLQLEKILKDIVPNE